jgi:hypothetical protein
MQGGFHPADNDELATMEMGKVCATSIFSIGIYIFLPTF